MFNILDEYYQEQQKKGLGEGFAGLYPDIVPSRVGLLA
jgi:hypothetical protein